MELHRILTALRNQDIGPALQWSIDHRPFLSSRHSSLEFHLHRSQYVHLLLSASSTATPSDLALNYLRTHLKAFWSSHSTELKRLVSCVTYIPLERLRRSPYADLAAKYDNGSRDVEALFASEYCAALGMSVQVPLRVVGDIGGGGALSRIEKGRKVMRERKSGWSQTDELPASCSTSTQYMRTD